MSITRADVLTAVGYQYKYALTIKKNDTYEAIQWVCDDIAGEFDGFRGLEDSTSNLPLTKDIASIDVSSAISALRNNRIMKVALIDTDNHDNDYDLEEKDYLEDYLKIVPDPTNPSAVKDYDIPEIYARYGNLMYFYPIPDRATLEVKIYFDKVHPTVSDSQDILYPADFKQLIVTGVLGNLYDMAERKDGLPNDRLSKYYEMRTQKLSLYITKPNLKRKMKLNW